MRRIAVPAMLAAMVATAVSAAPAQGAITAACHSKSDTYLFWPQGHGARPGAGFDAFPVPHLELYRGKLTTTFPDSANDAYVDSLGNAGADEKCDRGKGAFASGTVSHAKTATKEASVVCGFGAVVVHRLGKVSGGARLQTLRKGRPVVDVRMSQSGSSIRFDARYCTKRSSPA